jgi:uncharacterized protein (DUF1684 family)
MQNKLALVLIVAIVVCAACKQETKSAPAPIDRAAYENEIEQWQKNRLASLTKDDGWLTLIGLYWLNEGENKFGSDKSNAIVLPKDKVSAFAGSFWLEGGQVQVITRPSVPASIAGHSTADGASIGDRLIATGTRTTLDSDTAPNGPTVLLIDSLRINVIKRGDRFGIRVKDTQSQTRREFKGLEYYPVDPKWRIEARFEPYNPQKKIPITNVLSMTSDEPSPGALAFEIDGQTYRVDPILEEGETDWFVMIADKTTGKETYGAGRYLYVTPADASGKVIIDFNKAYSPPCAFTNYATCPLPPQQNRLPIRIDAGEKKYAGTVH